jgi:hypothetical protein
MTRFLKLVLCVGGALVLHANTRAAVGDASTNPYQGIPASNVFRLQPVVVHTQVPPPIALPRIVFAGITTFNRKCVLLNVRMPGIWAGQPKE